MSKQGFEQQVEGLMDFFHRSNNEPPKPLPGTVHGRKFSEYLTMMSGMSPAFFAQQSRELGLPKSTTPEQVIIAMWNRAAGRRDARGYDRPF